VKLNHLFKARHGSQVINRATSIISQQPVPSLFGSENSRQNNFVSIFVTLIGFAFSSVLLADKTNIDQTSVEIDKTEKLLGGQRFEASQQL